MRAGLLNCISVVLSAGGPKPDQVFRGPSSPQQGPLRVGACVPLRGRAEAEGDPDEAGTGSEAASRNRPQEGGVAQEKCVRVNPFLFLALLSLSILKDKVTTLNKIFCVFPL